MKESRSKFPKFPTGIVFIVGKYVKTTAGVVSIIEASIADFGSSTNRTYFGYDNLRDFLSYIDYLDRKYSDLGYKVRRLCNVSISR